MLADRLVAALVGWLVGRYAFERRYWAVVWWCSLARLVGRPGGRCFFECRVVGWSLPRMTGRLLGEELAASLVVGFGGFKSRRFFSEPSRDLP